MQRIILLILLAAAPFLNGTAQQVIDLEFISTLGSARLDTGYASFDAGGTDTTEWLALRDSSIHGGTSASFYLLDDTATGFVTAQWGVYDPETNATLPFLQTTGLDSLTSGIPGGALKNPVSAFIHGLKPPGATRVRFIIDAGATVGQFGTGAKRIPKVKAQAVVPDP
ncbi:MAG: hypothetical protein CL946_06600 [Ectothiorhodospiraceae bacterium]|nr:hypothetical protein [Ectothiorhodospiraceae bacterium]